MVSHRNVHHPPSLVIEFKNFLDALDIRRDSSTRFTEIVTTFNNCGCNGVCEIRVLVRTRYACIEWTQCYASIDQKVTERIKIFFYMNIHCLLMCNTMSDPRVKSGSNFN